MTISRKIEAVIFDMDGLMIDSEPIYWAAGRAVAQHFARTVSDETLGRMMGRSPIQSMRVFAEELGLVEAPDQLLQMRESIALQSFRRGVPAMPGLQDVLERLSRSFGLAIATSAPRAYVDLILGKLNLLDCFKAIQTSDDVIHGKPDPEIYLRAMSRLGKKPEACVVLEDSSNGALAGHRAGAYVIAIPSQYTRHQDFSFADYVAADLLDAARRIESLAGADAKPSGGIESYEQRRAGGGVE